VAQAVGAALHVSAQRRGQPVKMPCLRRVVKPCPGAAVSPARLFFLLEVVWGRRQVVCGAYRRRQAVVREVVTRVAGVEGNHTRM